MIFVPVTKTKTKKKQLKKKHQTKNTDRNIIQRHLTLHRRKCQHPCVVSKRIKSRITGLVQAYRQASSNHILHEEAELFAEKARDACVSS